MTQTPTIKACAFVLKTLDYGDSDRIITFYTKEYGKIKGFAKSARKSTKRFGNALEPFSQVRVFFSRRSRDSLVFLKNCEVVHHYPGIREDIEKTMTASYLSELVDKFTVEEKRIPAIFTLLENFMSVIDGNEPSEIMTRFFEVRILKFCGYEPQLTSCILCNTPLEEIRKPLFSLSDGALLCDKCGQMKDEVVPVSAGTLRILSLGKDMHPSRLPRIVPNDAALRESRQMMFLFIRHILGHELKSLRVLNEIKRLL